MLEKDFRVNIRKTLLTLCLIFSHIFVNAAQIESTGLGLIEQNNLAKARQAAIEDAKRLAVEQLLGSYISARTETKNFMLASEKIYATTKGRLDRFDVLEESKLDEFTYQVKIRAYTDNKAVTTEALKLLKQNKWTKKPRIKIIAKAGVVNTASLQAVGALKANIANSLSQQGFVVLDESADLGASFDLKLDVNASANKSEFQGMSINTNQVSVSGFLLNAATQDQITSVSFAEKQAGDSSESVLKMAQQISKRIVQKVNLETKFRWLDKLENPVLINIINANSANSANVQAIENDLKQAVAGLSGLTTESKTANNTSLSASYLGWPEQLFDQLNQLSTRSDIRFNVVSFEQSKLTLSIK